MQVLAFPVFGPLNDIFALLELWVGWEPSHVNVELSSSVFAYYSRSMFHGSEAEKSDIWRIAIMEFFDFAIVPLVAAAGDGVFMPKYTGPRIVMRYQCPYIWPVGFLIWAFSLLFVRGGSMLSFIR